MGILVVPSFLMVISACGDKTCFQRISFCFDMYRFNRYVFPSLCNHSAFLLNPFESSFGVFHIFYGSLNNFRFRS